MHIIVAVGRKLLSGLYAILKKGIAYDPNRGLIAILLWQSVDINRAIIPHGQGFLPSSDNNINSQLILNFLAFCSP